MKNTLQDIEQLQSRFQSCQKIFTALGDENRQRLLCIMLGGQCGGSRVVDIAGKTNAGFATGFVGAGGGIADYDLSVLTIARMVIKFL